MLLRNHRFAVGVFGVIVCLTIILGGLIKFAPIVRAASLEEFRADLDFMRNHAMATLLFNPFGDNPDPRFEKHHLTEDQVRWLCRNDVFQILDLDLKNII